MKKTGRSHLNFWSSLNCLTIDGKVDRTIDKVCPNGWTINDLKRERKILE